MDQHTPPHGAPPRDSAPTPQAGPGTPATA
ncbi:hypothetical protein SUDANB108_03791 [Streptomyces sp. enrichment culture]